MSSGSGVSQVVQRVTLPAAREFANGRWIAALLMVLIVVCACTSTKPANTAVSPYPCIPAPRPPAPMSFQTQIDVIGDSYTGGSTQGGTGDKRWTAVAAAELQRHGINPVVKIGAEGGSGYVNRGSRTGEVFADMVAATVRPAARLVVVFGSINDANATAGQMARATCDTLRSAQTIAGPGSRLLVIGPPWVNANPPPYIVQSGDILRVRCQELGATFLDPIADRWFVDHPDLIGADGVHPTDAGHQYMSDKIEPVLEQLLTASPER